MLQYRKGTGPCDIAKWSLLFIDLTFTLYLKLKFFTIIFISDGTTSVVSCMSCDRSSWQVIMTWACLARQLTTSEHVWSTPFISRISRYSWKDSTSTDHRGLASVDRPREPSLLRSQSWGSTGCWYRTRRICWSLIVHHTESLMTAARWAARCSVNLSSNRSGQNQVFTRNSSADEIANVNFFCNDIVHVLQNRIKSGFWNVGWRHCTT